jgi:tetratricopeptide (TPR) repeat protein
MLFTFALVTAVQLAPCTGSTPIDLPPPSAASRKDLRAVRALVAANKLAEARARWASLGNWLPADGATAYGRADAAFSARNYRVAFRAYDQALFCDQTNELDPAAENSGAASLLDSALQHAVSGNFAEAREQLRVAANHDAGSIESRYFLGLVELASGKPRAARAAWKAAIDSDGYAQPPGEWTLPRAQEAAIERYLGEQRI